VSDATLHALKTQEVQANKARSTFGAIGDDYFNITLDTNASLAGLIIG